MPIVMFEGSAHVVQIRANGWLNDAYAIEVKQINTAVCQATEADILAQPYQHVVVTIWYEPASLG